MSQQGNSTQTPDLTSLLRRMKADIFNTLNSAKVGTIKKIDATKRTAQVQVAFKRILPDGTSQSYPLLLDVPIVTAQGGGAALTFPIAAGDECLVLFADANIDAWYANGGEAIPFDGRQHSPSDAIAIVGLNSLAHPLTAALVTGEAALTLSGAKVGVKAGKVTIANGSQNLETTLNSLLTTLATLTTTLGTMTTATITAGTTQTAIAALTAQITARSVELAALLY